MKIICDSCGAKYSIADEKVRGKVFKIRCKKCSEVIMVQGPTMEEHTSPGIHTDDIHPPKSTLESAAMWFVVIAGEQVGPISATEVIRYFTSGQLNADSFIWKEGFSDWLSLKSVDEFAPLLKELAGPTEHTGIAENPYFNEHDQPANGTIPNEVTEIVQMHSGVVQPDSGHTEQQTHSDTGLAPDSEGATVDASLPISAHKTAASSDVDIVSVRNNGHSVTDSDATIAERFDSGISYSNPSYGQHPSSEYGGGMDEVPFHDPSQEQSVNENGWHALQDITGNAAVPTSSSAESFIGRRNENSVLFSLNSIDQLSATSGDTSQNKVTQASGLIDIQSLASSHRAMKNSDTDKSPTASALTAFNANSMHIPALMPMGSHRSNKWLIVGIVVGGILLVAVTVTAALLIIKGQQAPTTHTIVESTPENEPDNASGPNNADIEGVAPVIDEEEQQALLAAQALAMQEEGASAEEVEAVVAKSQEKAASDSTKSPAPPAKNPEPVVKKTKSSRSASKNRQNTSNKRSAAKAPAVKTTKKKSAAPAPKKKASASSSGGLDDILGQMGASSAPSAAPAARTPSASPKKNADIPAALTRPMVQNTVAQYNARVLQCAQSSNSGRLKGVVYVRYTIEPSGSVSSATVQTAEFKGTDLGRCIESVVRSMQFPQTQSSRTINYPFDLS